jgi:hypothetical protein
VHLLTIDAARSRALQSALSVPTSKLLLKLNDIEGGKRGTWWAFSFVNLLYVESFCLVAHESMESHYPTDGELELCVYPIEKCCATRRFSPTTPPENLDTLVTNKRLPLSDEVVPYANGKTPPIPNPPELYGVTHFHVQLKRGI